MYPQALAPLNRVGLSVAVSLVHESSLEAQMSQACQQPNATFQGRNNACLPTGGQNSETCTCCQPEEPVANNNAQTHYLNMYPATNLPQAVGHSWHSLQQ